MLINFLDSEYWRPVRITAFVILVATVFSLGSSLALVLNQKSTVFLTETKRITQQSKTVTLPARFYTVENIEFVCLDELGVIMRCDP